MTSLKTTFRVHKATACPTDIREILCGFICFGFLVGHLLFANGSCFELWCQSKATDATVFQKLPTPFHRHINQAYFVRLQLSILLSNVNALLTRVSFFYSCADRIAVACSAGTFVAPDKLSCEQCLAGHYCPVDKIDAPVICSNGTYQNATGQTSCIQCPAGKRCPSVADVPIDCEMGTYSPVATNECMSCPSGHRYGIFVL